MPHYRKRFSLDKILKKLRYFRVVGVELLAPESPRLVYQTFDQPTIFEFANANPETFLNQYSEASPLVIDEAQKVPKIFDAVKFVVDQKQIPGQFLLLGLTEFSKKTLIREALTGRIGLVRLFPMTCAETLQLPFSNMFPFSPQKQVTRAQFMKYLTHGGMPGLCFIRDEAERRDQVKAWLDTTVNRDLALIPKLKLNPDLAMAILRSIATLEEPHAGNIAKALKRDPRVINTHLLGLEMLFVIQRIMPHTLSTGKPLYFLCDVGFAAYLGANFEKQLHTATLQELYAKNEISTGSASQIRFYRTTKGRFIHFVIEETNAPLTAPLMIVKLIFSEKIDKRDFEVLKAFSKKIAGREVKMFALSPLKEQIQMDGVQLIPWESVC